MFRQIMKLRWLQLLFVAVVAVFAVASCGGGGSSGAGQTATGSVSLLVTDLPTDQYCEINVTITEVILIGDDGQVTLYSNTAGKTFNLLKLAHHSEVFSHTTGVPAGTYSKIRMILDGGVQLKPTDTCGNPSTWIEARVPSDKLDLNPQGDFTVPENGVLIVELDMDAKAFKLTETGSGHYLVRPVVFVNVMTDDGMGKLVRVFGTVENKMEATEGGSFDLCRTSIAWHDEKHNDDTARCVMVQVGGETSFFNALGDPVTFADLNNGDPATVIGRLAVSTMHSTSADDDMYDDMVVLSAEVVEIGDQGVFGRYSGIVRSVPVAADDGFNLELFPPQGILTGTVVPVDLQAGTKLYSRQGDAVSVDAFDLGQYALVEGVLVIGTEDFIKSSVVWLDLNADQMVYEGSVDPDSVDLVARTFTLMPTSASLPSDTVVRVTTEAVILLVSETAGVLSNERITLEEMAALAGMYDAEVYGIQQTDGSILSDRIILQAHSPAP